MKLRVAILMIPLLVAASARLDAALAPLVPIKDFARTPEVGDMRLSPDGTAVAFLSDFDGRSYLCVKEFANERIARFRLGDAQAFGTVVRKQARDFEWVNDQRLLVTTGVWDAIYGVAAFDRSSGQRWVGISGYELDPQGHLLLVATDVIHKFDDPEASILMLDRRDTDGAQRLFPHVIKVNTAHGGFTTVVRNPGNVVAWQADHQGVVRVGIIRDGDEAGVVYRDDEQSPWRALPLPQRGPEQLRALGFDPTNGTFYVAGLNETDRRAVYPYDVQNGTLGEAILSDPEYDVVGGPRVRVGGTSLGGMVFSRQQQALVGVWYITDAPRVRWFDESYIGFQRAVDRALPDTINVTVDQSRDDRKMLVFAFSDRDPGRYFVVDRESRSLKQIGAVCPWIRPADMAPMVAVRLEARDGLRLHGYLTVPVGRAPKNLPLVMLPHGGPWVRDVWGFDPLVQLLANRGFAVLQVNYRGSPGYGSEFALKGRREIGRGIQHDIEDAVRWAVATGLADPQRLAILGSSYGGYSALFALGHNPGLYRCGISINGVTDWVAIFRSREHDGEYRFARERWEREIGDLEEDEEFLRSISPVNFAGKIEAPVLIVQGREDRTVPPRQARDMVAALKRAGRAVEDHFVGGEGHSIREEKPRAAMYARIVTFLEAHLGPGR